MKTRPFKLVLIGCFGTLPLLIISGPFGQWRFTLLTKNLSCLILVTLRQNLTIQRSLRRSRCVRRVNWSSFLATGPEVSSPGAEFAGKAGPPGAAAGGGKSGAGNDGGVQACVDQYGLM